MLQTVKCIIAHIKCKHKLIYRHKNKVTFPCRASDFPQIRPVAVLFQAQPMSTASRRWHYNKGKFQAEK